MNKIKQNSPREKMILSKAMKDIDIPKHKEDKKHRRVPTDNTNDINDIIQHWEDKLQIKELMKDNNVKYFIPPPPPGFNAKPTKISSEYVKGSPLEADPDWFDKMAWKIFNIQPSTKPNAWFNYNRAIGLRRLLIKLSKWLIRSLVSMFVDNKLRQFTEHRISQYFHNGELYNWFTKQINEVYKKHPEYRPVPIEEYKKTRFWQNAAAEWRDKTTKQKLHKARLYASTLVFMYLCTHLSPPFFLTELVMSLPIRILLAYFGYQFIFGSIYDIVAEHEGNSLLLKLSLTKDGFALTDPELYVIRTTDGKLVRVDLPQVPKELYLIRESDIREFEKNTNDSLQDESIMLKEDVDSQAMRISNIIKGGLY